MKTALVTGAASGIGLAIADRLEGDGWQVQRFDIQQGDLTTREGNRRAVESTLETFGRLDAIIANAGFQHVAPIRDLPEDRWDSILALLLSSPFLLAKYGWDALSKSGDGRFLAIASVHAVVASPFKSAYVAAKHGVLGLVKTIALEGASAGISAAAICPGYTRTPLVEMQVAAQAKAHGISEERVLEDVLLAPHAVKRLIEPDEIADLTVFLLGRGGRAITGSPVIIDLGWSAR